jgi:hypothetical protein
MIYWNKKKGRFISVRPPVDIDPSEIKLEDLEETARIDMDDECYFRLSMLNELHYLGESLEDICRTLNAMAERE